MLVKAVFVIVIMLIAITGIYFLFEKLFFKTKENEDTKKKVNNLEKTVEEIRKDKTSCNCSCNCSKEKTDGNSAQK